MNSPHIMSTCPLQPSPFCPDQFLSQSTHQDSDDEDTSSPRAFIKKRPIELTEDLIEGRVQSRLRRCRSPPALHRAFSEPPDFAFPFASQDVEPLTPPNRAQSPVALAARDMSLAREADRLRHPSQSRRKPNSRRSPKARRSCIGIPNRKSATFESSPVFPPPRSPLGRWTPPAMSAMPLFSAEDPTTPPPRPASAYPFGVLPPHSWSNRVPWTVTSPSTSPYPAHSPLPDCEHPA